MTNRVTEILGTQYPLVLGPMAFTTDGKLSGAVSDAGGLGTIALIGDADAIIENIKIARDMTDNPIALNVIYGYDDIETIIPEAIALGCKNFVLIKQANNTREEIKEIITFIKDAGGTVIYRPLNPTIKDSVAGEEDGADIVVVTGADEGGGFPTQDQGLFSVLPQIVDAINIPVLAAGCIVDNRSVNAAFALGAEGVYAGSAFLVAEECVWHDNAKQALVDTIGEDLITVKLDPVNYFRTVPTTIAQKSQQLVDEGKTLDEARETLDYGWQNFAAGMLEGDLENGIISVNMAVGSINEIRPAKEIVESFFDGVEY